MNNLRMIKYNVIHFKLANKYKINEKNDKYIYTNQFFENKTKNEIENNTKKTKFVENKTVENKTKNEILENNTKKKIVTKMLN
jgi:hypothetical protein